jgi:hypothetical protein
MTDKLQNKYRIESTYGLNCDYGWNEMKIPLTKIEITSNSYFNELASAIWHGGSMTVPVRKNNY